MNVHGMKECSRALQERDERQSQASVLRWNDSRVER